MPTPYEPATISYSEDVKGWPSFYSFLPDWMIGMNGYFYSWNGGNLYRHNTNPLRNNYYGVQYNSTITSVFNEEPLTIKLFKTMSYESNDRWECTALFSDLSTGSMLQTFFEQGCQNKVSIRHKAYVSKFSSYLSKLISGNQGRGLFLRTLVIS